MRWFHAVAALAYIVWASHRLYVAWRRGYVVEIDDPQFGFETSQMYRSERPGIYWFSVTVTGVLLVLAIIFIFFIGADLISP